MSISYFSFSVLKRVSGLPRYLWDCHGCDRMAVGFTTSYAISIYHH